MQLELLRQVHGHLLAISKNNEDLSFGKALAAEDDFKFDQAETRDRARKILVAYPQTWVLWDADAEDGYESIAEILPKYVRPEKILAVTEKHIGNYPYLFRHSFFNHHLQRRESSSSLKILSWILSNGAEGKRFDLASHFPKNSLKRISISRTAQKRAAIEATQKYLTQQGVIGRLAALVAQAVDELIINAMFDAPRDKKGLPYRWDIPRDSSFELSGKSLVNVEIAHAQNYMAASVIDQYGSLKREPILGALGKYYRKPGETDSGLGLRGAYQAGLSLVFALQANKGTQVTLFFEKTRSYRAFRTSFRFLSILESK